MTSSLPPGATPIDLGEFYEAIGELYFQTRRYQRVIAQLQRQASNEGAKSEQLNGTVHDAVQLES